MEFSKCSLSFFLWFYTCWSSTDPYSQRAAGQINYYSSFKTQSKWLFFEVPFLTSLGSYLLKVLLLTDDITYYITCCLWIYLATGLGAPSGHDRGSCHPFFLESSGTYHSGWCAVRTQCIFVEGMSKIAKETKFTLRTPQLPTGVSSLKKKKII